MGDELRQYKIIGCIVLEVKADYFHNELPPTDILEYLVANCLSESEEVEAISFKTSSIRIEDMTK